MKTHNVVGVMEISAPDLPLYVGVDLPTGCSHSSELITLQQGVSFSDGQVRPLTPARWILRLYSHKPLRLGVNWFWAANPTPTVLFPSCLILYRSPANLKSPLPFELHCPQQCGRTFTQNRMRRSGQLFTGLIG
ncbi:hypothetical protein SeF6a_225 [Salmonella phage SeF6a]|nr:hypothetical protein SeF6a_225 [Salmonella phage SeF6a]